MFRGLSVYTGNAHPAFAQDICRDLGIPLGEAEVFKFKNDEIFVQMLDPNAIMPPAAPAIPKAGMAPTKAVPAAQKVR